MHAAALAHEAARLNAYAGARLRRRHTARPAAEAVVAAPVNLPRLDPRSAVAIEAVEPGKFGHGHISKPLTLEQGLDMLPRVILDEVSPLAPPSENRRILIEVETPIDEAESNQAALRGHLLGAYPYGPEVSRVMLTVTPSGIRRLVVAYGRLSAIHRAYPDAMTREAWEQAMVRRPKDAVNPAQMELFPV